MLSKYRVQKRCQARSSWELACLRNAFAGSDFVSMSPSGLSSGLLWQEDLLHRPGILIPASALLCLNPSSLPLLWSHEFSFLYHEVPGSAGSLDSSV